MKKVTFVFLGIIIIAGGSFAATIHVPEDYPTIGAAISAASDGDSIVVGPGIYDYVPTVFNEPDHITLIGNGYVGTSRSTIVGNLSGEIEGKIDLRYVEGWNVSGFEIIVGRKGINTYYVDSCYFHDVYIHDLSWDYGNGIMVNGTNVTIERCVIENCPPSGIEVFYPPQSGHVFRNNTIAYCSNGILVRGQVPNLLLENNIITGCPDGVEFVGVWTGSELLDYNDLYANGDNWIGCYAGSHNLYVYPEFVGGSGAERYTLQVFSPCIDAGNPASPPDPDGTIADIGCFYFNQNFQSGNLTLLLEPMNPPIIIPVQGGSFSYDALLYCDSTNYVLFDAWTDLLLPNGQIMGPLFVRSNLYLDAGDSLFRELSLYVSAWAMPGIYEFRGYLGNHPDSVWATDSFTFEKLAAEGFNPGNGDAYLILSGWGKNERVELPIVSSSLPDHLNFGSSPNPFNPETTLRFSVPTAGHVALKIYDLAGRTVASLLDRDLAAGWHTAQFNGSHASTGVYFAVLEWQGERIIERLLLLK